MVLDVDRVTILYAVGILLGIAATFYFGFQLLEDLSPVTTAFLLFLGFAGLLIVAVALETERLDLVVYALSAGFYLVFVAYLLATFDLGDGGTFLLLAGSSGLFIALGYLASRGLLVLSRRQAQLGVVVVLLVGVALVGIDVVGAQSTESATFESEIDVPEPREMVQVGTVTVENEFFLPRETDLTRYYACVYTPAMEPTSLRHDPSPRDLLLSGGETREFALTLPSRPFYDADGELREGVRDHETIPVERADDCPDDVDEPRIVVVTDSPRV